MVKAIYVMKNTKENNISKFGHRTGQNIEAVKCAVDKDYSSSGYRCVMLYAIQTDDNNVEKFVANVRRIINLISGNLALDKPEYYKIESEKIIEILDALEELLCPAQNYGLCKIDF